MFGIKQAIFAASALVVVGTTLYSYFKQDDSNEDPPSSSTLQSHPLEDSPEEEEEITIVPIDRTPSPYNLLNTGYLHIAVAQLTSTLVSILSQLPEDGSPVDDSLLWAARTALNAASDYYECCGLSVLATLQLNAVSRLVSSRLDSILAQRRNAPQVLLIEDSLVEDLSSQSTAAPEEEEVEQHTETPLPSPIATARDSPRTTQPSAPSPPIPAPTTAAQPMPQSSFNISAPSFVPRSSVPSNAISAQPLREASTPTAVLNTSAAAHSALNATAPAFNPTKKNTKTRRANSKKDKKPCAGNCSLVILPPRPLTSCAYITNPQHPLSKQYVLHSSFDWHQAFDVERSHVTRMQHLDVYFDFVVAAALEVQDRYLTLCEAVDKKGIPDMESIQVTLTDKEVRHLVNGVLIGWDTICYAVARLQNDENCLMHDGVGLNDPGRWKCARLAYLVSRLQMLVSDMGDILSFKVSKIPVLEEALKCIHIAIPFLGDPQGGPPFYLASTPSSPPSTSNGPSSSVGSTSGATPGNASPMSASGSVAAFDGNDGKRPRPSSGEVTQCN